MENRNTRRAFTLIELLAVVAIIGILSAIIIASVGSARDQAKRAACSANVRQLGEALLLYAGDHKGFGPTGDGSKMNELSIGGVAKVFGPLLPYTGVDVTSMSNLKKTPSVFICPACGESKMTAITVTYPGVQTGYYMNPQDLALAIPVKLMTLPAQRAVIADYCNWWNADTSDTYNHGGKGMNVFRLDGSVQWLPHNKTAGLTSWSWAALDHL